MAESTADEARDFDTIMRVVVDSATGLVGYWDKQLRCRFANSAYRLWFGKTPDQMQGIRIQDLFGEELFKLNEPHIRAALEGKEQSFERQILKPDGQAGWIWARYLPHLSNGEVLGFVVSTLDITELKSAQEAQERAAERLSLATRASGVGIWEWDIVRNGSFWDESMHDLYGLTKDQYSVAYQDWSLRVHPGDIDRCNTEIQLALGGRKEYDSSFRVVWPDASIKTLRSLARVTFDASGNPLRMLGTSWDITEQKRNEALLQSSVAEKDALLKEVHHRVKNNLQVITSLLRLEAARSEVADTRSVLGEMKGRIHAMAQLHESLYRSGTFAHVDFGAYLERLAVQVFQNQAVANNSVRLSLDMGSVQVGMDQATVGGLLLNELITNSIKHGFRDRRSGEVRVSLQPVAEVQGADARWRLSVSDTGVGLPADFEERRKTSLGLQLVDDLSQQFGSALEIESAPDRGARFTVSFTAQEPAPDR